ncbi:MAG: hypothetical protein NC336_04280 [Clostridium sp.]|nr:hypothetical protein [Clostridium sp.]
MTIIDKHIRRPFLAAALLLAFSGGQEVGAQTRATASLDSAYILMGKQTTLHLETNSPEGQPVELLLPAADTLIKEVEVIRTVIADSSVANGRLVVRRDITIQSFDSGLYTIPPLKVLIGQDTVLSNHTVLKVVPANVDSLQGRIHDYAGVEEPSRHFLDFIPGSVYNYLFWILCALAVIGLGIWAWLYWKRNLGKAAVETVRQVPPYDEAIGALRELREEKLCEKGHEREFYTRLTDILRNYLYRRFGISAMEMTSTEILRALSENSETRLTRKQMQEILSMADFVKFAKLRPLPDDNVRTWNQSVEFVESTRPAPEPAESETAAEGEKKENVEQ